ncbi:MAG: ribulose 1,5-bisphosphate carboxylase [Chloroflexi bacterium]|nr:ribulose 1,5-bisphosphate carboxylase [Chloroflexota bacterium]
MPALEDHIVALNEGLDPASYVIGTFIIQGPSTDDMLQRAASFAVEQTVGRGIFSMPDELMHLLHERGGKVISLFSVPDHETRVTRQPGEWQRWVTRIAFPVENTGYQIPMLLTAVLSDISMGGMVKMVDLDLPSRFLEAFQGPKFGLAGVREVTHTSKSHRPLVLTILKPCAGMSAKEAAAIFYEQALGGADFIKDDELMAYADDLRVEDRVRACMEAEKRAYEQTGEHVVYLANITDRPDRMRDSARRAIDAGAPGLMLTPLTTGIGALQMLAEDPEIQVPIFAHPGGLGSVSWSPDFGIAEHIYISKLFRIAGADLLAVPVPYGKFTHMREHFIKMFKMNASPMQHIKPVFTQTGGGVTPINTYTILQDLGDDVMLAAGGAIQQHPMGVTAGVRAMRQAIQAYVDKVPLAEAAKQHKELGVAYEKWGTEL